ncbi:hypothetical protein NDU88_005504 [Pleurodeles waltl]|uniref:Uncharacterized protein n=1 Tax=Pleurodeles waltl TaxID=8319 RepID=A0AAV7N0S0_PLEWA|nr:hypothetical protein NDU88_005504 [Pleurodeles waltl]
MNGSHTDKNVVQEQISSQYQVRPEFLTSERKAGLGLSQLRVATLTASLLRGIITCCWRSRSGDEAELLVHRLSPPENTLTWGIKTPSHLVHANPCHEQIMQLPNHGKIRSWTTKPGRYRLTKDRCCVAEESLRA